MTVAVTVQNSGGCFCFLKRKLLNSKTRNLIWTKQVKKNRQIAELTPNLKNKFYLLKQAGNMTDFELLFTCFPHLAEEIFRSLDEDTLINCFEVSKSWRKFLSSNHSLITKLTSEHQGWDVVLGERNMAIIPSLAESFIDLVKGFISHEYKFPSIHPIFCGIHSGNLELFQNLTLLFPRFQEPDYYSGPWYYKHPFHFAARRGKLSIVNYFVEIAATEKEKNPMDKFGVHTPLHIASLCGHFEITKLLLTKIQGDKSPRSRAHGHTPLHLAARNQRYEIVNLIMDNIKGTKNPGDDNGNTPLHIASKRGWIKIVELILNKIKGNKNPGNNYGITPLHLASEEGHYEIVNLLLDNIRVEKNPKDKFGSTPLHLAAAAGHSKVVKLILDKIKGNKMPKDEDGKTPLDMTRKKEIRKLFKRFPQ